MSSTSPNLRALASRRNGARSRGPKTAAGKARAARNAITHGLTARRHLLLDDEDAAAFAAFEAATRSELAPVGVFQADLVARIVAAAWRARRADRLEAALLGRYLAAGAPGAEGERQATLALQLIRDGNGPRALDALVRYRGSVLAELFRALAALWALRAEKHAVGARCVLPPAPPPRPNEPEKSNEIRGLPDRHQADARACSARGSGPDRP